MIAAFLSPVGRWFASAAAIAVLVGGILLRVFSAGKQSAKSAQREADLHDTGIRRDVDADVRAASDEDLERRARRWM